MCDLCGGTDGRVFKMSEFKVGATAPPFHPWCRCCTAPYFADMEGVGRRYARDPDDEFTYTVPKDMTYKQWKAMQEDVAEAASISGQRMSLPTKEDWSEATVHTNSTHDLENLHNFARENGIHFVYPTKFDGDIDLCREQIKAISKLKVELNIKGKISLGYSYMGYTDMGMVTKNNRTIFINSLASRSRKVTNAILNADDILSSTDAIGVGVHELGHIWVAQYGSKGIDIARKAYYNIYKENLSSLEMLDYFEDNISKYSVYMKPQKRNTKHFNQRDFPEVIPEILAKDFTNPTEFTNEFVRLMKEVTAI